MTKRRDITGQHFNMLTAIKFVSSAKGVTFWLFECDCGNRKILQMVNVVHGTTKSCGCLKRAKGGQNKTHGLTGTKVYHAWQAMRGRCSPNSNDRKHYYDRGIRVHDEWVSSFEKFYEHIGPPPTSKHTLDRIDGDRGYEPGNVRWATWKEQQNNRGYNVFIDTPDGRMTTSKALEQYAIPKSSFYKLKRQGMSGEDAINTYLNRKLKTT